MPLIILAVKSPIVVLITVFGTLGAALVWAHHQMRDVGDKR